MTMLLLISACGGDGTPEEIIEENAAKIISTSNKLISIDVGTGFQFQSPRPDSEQYCKNFRDKLEIIENENIKDNMNTFYNDLEILDAFVENSPYNSIAARFGSMGLLSNVPLDDTGYKIMRDLITNMKNVNPDYLKLQENGKSVGLVVCGDSRVNCVNNFIHNGEQWIISEQRAIGSPGVLFPAEVDISIIMTHGNTCADTGGCGAQTAYGQLRDNGAQFLIDHGVPDVTVDWLSANLVTDNPFDQSVHSAIISSNVNSLVHGGDKISFFTFNEHGTNNIIIKGAAFAGDFDRTIPGVNQLHQNTIVAMFNTVIDATDDIKAMDAMDELFRLLESGEVLLDEGSNILKTKDGRKLISFLTPKYDSSVAGKMTIHTVESLKSDQAFLNGVKQFKNLLIGEEKIGSIINSFRLTQMGERVNFFNNGLAVINKMAVAGQAPLQNIIYATKTGRPIGGSGGIFGSYAGESGNFFKISINLNGLIQSNSEGSYALKTARIDTIRAGIRQDLYNYLSAHNKWSDVTYLLSEDAEILGLLVEEHFSNKNIIDFINNKDNFYTVIGLVDEQTGLIKNAKIVQVIADGEDAQKIAKQVGGIVKIIEGTELVESEIKLNGIAKLFEYFPDGTVKAIYRIRTSPLGKGVSNILSIISKSKIGNFGKGVFNGFIKLQPLWDTMFALHLDHIYTEGKDYIHLYDESKIWNAQNINLELEVNNENNRKFPKYYSSDEYMDILKNSPNGALDPYMYNGKFHQAISNDILFESYVNGAYSLLSRLDLTNFQITIENYWSWVGCIVPNSECLKIEGNTFDSCVQSCMDTLISKGPTVLSKEIVLSYIDGSIYNKNEGEKPYERRKFATPLIFLPTDYEHNKFYEISLPSDDSDFINEKQRVRNIFASGDEAAPMIVFNKMNGEYVMPCTDSQMIVPIRAVNPAINFVDNEGKKNANGVIYYISVFSSENDDRIHFKYLDNQELKYEFINENVIPSYSGLTDFTRYILNEKKFDNTPFDLCYDIDDSFDYTHIQKMTNIDYDEWIIDDYYQGKETPILGIEPKKIRFSEILKDETTAIENSMRIYWKKGNKLYVPKNSKNGCCPDMGGLCEKPTSSPNEDATVETLPSVPTATPVSAPTTGEPLPPPSPNTDISFIPEKTSVCYQIEEGYEYGPYSNYNVWERRDVNYLINNNLGSNEYWYNRNHITMDQMKIELNDPEKDAYIYAFYYCQ